MKRSSIFAGLAPALLLGLHVTAAASPLSVPGLSPLPAQLPARCQPLAQIPSSATIPGPTLAAHVSIANCLAEEALRSFAASGGAPDAGDTAGIERLNAAVTPSLAMLDEVILAGDPRWQLIAQDAERDLYRGLIVRERSALPPGDAAARAALEPKLRPWLAGASRAEAAMRDLVRAHGDLARADPVTARLVREVTADQVAARP